MKRVIGLPGETIEGRTDGHIYVDGKLLHEPYLPEGTSAGPGFAPIKVPPDSYWVMGDNRPTRTTRASSRSTSSERRTSSGVCSCGSGRSIASGSSERTATNGELTDVEDQPRSPVDPADCGRGGARHVGTDRRPDPRPPEPTGRQPDGADRPKRRRTRPRT